MNLIKNIGFDCVILLFFCFFITIPAVVHFTSAENLDYIKHNEYRNPSQLPTFPRSVKDWENIPSSLEAFVNDRFGFRRQFITANNFLRVKLGFKTTGKVLLGNDGWLYYTAQDVVNDYRGIQPLSDDEISIRMEIFRKTRTMMEEQGIKTVFMLVPDKQSVYPEHLPSWAGPIGPSRFDQIVAAFKEEGFNFIDLRPALIAAKRWLPTYYKTDTHWNEYGAYVAYLALVNRIKSMYPDVVESLPPERVKFHEKKSSGRDLARMLYLSGTMTDQIFQPSFEQSHADVALSLKGREIEQTIWWKGTQYDSVVKSDAQNDLRILMMRDSFAIDMIQFLTNNFSFCVFTGDQGAIGQLQKKYKPDVFVWQTLERYF